MKIRNILIVIFFGIMLVNPLLAQISPGELAEVHAHLEGISNCTKCHHLGEKVLNENCLACHTEIKSRVDQQKGYHASAEIRGKECFSCHNDHHGRKFEIIRFDKEKFDHKLTGYELLGAHAKKTCKDCHKTEFITDQKIKDKKFTYLGLNTACSTCHDDYHQNTLSKKCDDCHNNELFKPAPKFDHSKAKFQLLGKHKTVDCLKCHKTETRNEKKFQEFAGLKFSNCTSCHKDVHENKFGQDCKQCHSEDSFHTIKGISNFDHDKTNFKLEEKHKTVACKSCHKTNLTDPLKYARCTDCHSDYHNKQFEKEGVSPDCNECHSIKGFSGSSFTIEKHNAGSFKIEGAHLATPCFECHKKQEKWSFREIGTRCSDCHEDIHKDKINTKYYPETDCRNCHDVETWKKVSFEHSKTKFELLGVHQKQSCKACHFPKDNEGKEQQRFSGLETACANCHNDKHFKQFETNGDTDCKRCHQFDNWKIPTFDHNKTRFVLDGNHKNVACNKCHKEKQIEQTIFVQYKFEDFKCETCHR